MQNMYEILEVSPRAAQATIDTVYRALVVKFSQQADSGDEDAANKIKFLAVAYGVLSDPGKRALYDARLEQSAPPARAQQRVADQKFCSECGASIRTNAEICPKCGVRQMSVPDQPSVHDRSRAPDRTMREDAEPPGHFYRSSDESMFAGVCAGLAHKWHVSRGGLRLVTLVSFLFFIPIIVYIGCWIVFPAHATRRRT